MVCVGVNEGTRHPHAALLLTDVFLMVLGQRRSSGVQRNELWILVSRIGLWWSFALLMGIADKNKPTWNLSLECTLLMVILGLKCKCQLRRLVCYRVREL